jgi:hypothetical protein
MSRLALLSSTIRALLDVSEDRYTRGPSSHGFPDRRLEDESAPLAGRAFGPYITVHHFRQTPADGETEPVNFAAFSISNQTKPPPALAGGGLVLKARGKGNRTSCPGSEQEGTAGAKRARRCWFRAVAHKHITNAFSLKFYVLKGIMDEKEEHRIRSIRIRHTIRRWLRLA